MPKMHLLLRAYSTRSIDEIIQKYINEDADRGLIGSITVVTNTGRDSCDTPGIVERVAHSNPGMTVRCVPLTEEEYGWSRALNQGIEGILADPSVSEDDQLVCLSNEVGMSNDQLYHLQQTLKTPGVSAAHPKLEFQVAQALGLGYHSARNTAMAYPLSHFLDSGLGLRFDPVLEQYGGMEDYDLLAKIYAKNHQLPRCSGDEVPITIRPTTNVVRKGVNETQAVAMIAKKYGPEVMGPLHQRLEIDLDKGDNPEPHKLKHEPTSLKDINLDPLELERTMLSATSSLQDDHDVLFSPSEQYRVYVTRGNNCSGMRNSSSPVDYEKALKAYTAAIDLNLDRPEAYALRARVFSKLGHGDEAQRDLAEVVRIRNERSGDTSSEPPAQILAAQKTHKAGHRPPSVLSVGR
ncbi:tetratricopeptide repeat protein [Piscirickettsia litoralis]|uniref:Glycosyltransferase 2-like domain-containing protein n=1 Tax=Piscirickettsia litoralis TaxID=1891921 RepID=A0ABX2ZYZ4_9GAMM|nr:hypothetical protein [Piscirickettsia litoralis]ODN41792.1 hypothetical protein BGC07_00850 [Piscirickettsia litoralis]